MKHTKGRLPVTVNGANSNINRNIFKIDYCEYLVVTADFCYT